ncbi:acetyltransferase [Histoplasma capsulatum G186AR]|uniref:Acetyltransferase n=2 Tax=Ajellomyces capsulatus TaxID=5037 RepID=C0NNF4_AJECG|nr:acetyltransferase [Histoplasma capsulatum G186AR]EEH07402.1 acetyltransferase [Histoplasma capsulatum G186AR]KAG5304463.1 acetyltransferase [Histoplasma capsulatum]QSS70061.1 acetyltransferase [Histoplasma capsulatum G186AR]
MAENPTKVEDQSVASSVGGDKNDISPGFSPPIRTTDSPITVSPPQSNSRVPPLIEGEAIDQHPAISQGDLVIAHEFETEDNEVSDEEDDEKEDGYVEVKHDDLVSCFRQSPPTKRTELDQLHPFIQLLSLSNLEDCLAVEAAFPENERCSLEKLAYRLTTCPELSLGAFYLPPKEPSKPKLRPQLIAHIIATRTRALYVTDASMGIPPNWRDKSSSRLQSSNWSEQPGHQDQGSTIALHSLAVLPEHQGKRLGSTLLKAYVQRIRDAEIANRIALLSHDHLIPFYTSLGFKNRGLSDCTFGGGGWYNMVLEFVNGRRLS